MLVRILPFKAKGVYCFVPSEHGSPRHCLVTRWICYPECMILIVIAYAADMFKRAVEARATFEMSHLYPPVGTSEVEKIRWKLMFPVEKRKEFILDELRKCTATTVVRTGNRCFTLRQINI